MKSQGNDATGEAAPVHILTLSCEDRPGIVAAVTAELAANGANIAESSQFWDRQTNRFFMRILHQPVRVDQGQFGTGPEVKR